MIIFKKGEIYKSVDGEYKKISDFNRIALKRKLKIKKIFNYKS